MKLLHFILVLISALYVSSNGDSCIRIRITHDKEDVAPALRISLDGLDDCAGGTSDLKSSPSIISMLMGLIGNASEEFSNYKLMKEQLRNVSKEIMELKGMKQNLRNVSMELVELKQMLTSLDKNVKEPRCVPTKLVGQRFPMGSIDNVDRTQTLMCDMGVNGFRIYKSGSNWLGGIQLRCANGENTEQMTECGSYCKWKPWKLCAEEESIVGFNYRATDRTSGTIGYNMKMLCKKGYEMDGEGGPEGAWRVSAYNECPPKQFFCGIKIWTLKGGYGIWKVEYICCKCEHM